MNERRVLVTDGGERAALATVRSLGSSGYQVWVCSPRQRSLAGASRFCAGEARVPDPLSEPAEYAMRVRELVERWEVGTLVPVSEASLLALLPDDRRPPGVRIPFPPEETFRAMSDKEHVLRSAEEVGICVPRQTTLTSPTEIRELLVHDDCFPLVLKPCRSVVEKDGVRHKLTVGYARNRVELEAMVTNLPDHAFPLLLQQRVVGDGVGIFLLIWNGAVRAIFSHRRLREKPPSGGVSVYRESIAAPPELIARSVALLRRFGWQGVAMVEFKVAATTGTPYLMEVNGRFWGSLQLAVDAGVDFPLLLLQAAQGEPSAAPPEYRVGVRSRWWWGDVDHLIARFRHADRALPLPPSTPSRWALLRSLFTFSTGGDRNEVFRIGDPRPFVRESVDWLRALIA